MAAIRKKRDPKPQKMRRLRHTVLRKADQVHRASGEKVAVFFYKSGKYTCYTSEPRPKVMPGTKHARRAPPEFPAPLRQIRQTTPIPDIWHAEDLKDIPYQKRFIPAYKPTIFTEGAQSVEAKSSGAQPVKANPPVVVPSIESGSGACEEPSIEDLLGPLTNPGNGQDGTDMDDELGSESEDSTDSDSDDEGSSDYDMQIESCSEHGFDSGSDSIGAPDGGPENLGRDDISSGKDSAGLDALVRLLGGPTLRSLVEHLSEKNVQRGGPRLPASPVRSSPSLVRGSPSAVRSQRKGSRKLCGDPASQIEPAHLVHPNGGTCSDFNPTFGQNSPPATPSPSKRPGNTGSTSNPAASRNEPNYGRPQRRATRSARPSTQPGRQDTSFVSVPTLRGAGRKDRHKSVNFDIVIPTQKQYLRMSQGPDAFEG